MRCGRVLSCGGRGQELLGGAWISRWMAAGFNSRSVSVRMPPGRSRTTRATSGLPRPCRSALYWSRSPPNLLASAATSVPSPRTNPADPIRSPQVRSTRASFVGRRPPQRAHKVSQRGAPVASCQEVRVRRFVASPEKGPAVGAGDRWFRGGLTLGGGQGEEFVGKGLDRSWHGGPVGPSRAAWTAVVSAVS